MLDNYISFSRHKKWGSRWERTRERTRECCEQINKQNKNFFSS